MSNFTRYFPAGFTPGPIPTAFINDIDIKMTKAPNADEGSDHVGHCSFGGLQAAQMRRKVNSTGGAPLTGVPGTITCDCDSFGHFHFNVTGAVTAQATLNFQNVRQGAEYVVDLDNTSGLLVPRPLFVFGGAGITHRFPDNESFDAPAGAGSRTIWRGLATKATEIRWTVEYLPKRIIRSDNIVERRLYEMVRGETVSGQAFPNASVKMAFPFVLQAEQNWNTPQVGVQSANLFRLPEQEWLFEYALIVLSGNWTNSSGSNKQLTVYAEFDAAGAAYFTAAQMSIDNAWFSGTTYALGQQIIGGLRETASSPFLDERAQLFLNGPSTGTFLSSQTGPDGMAAMDTVAPRAFRSTSGTPVLARIGVAPGDGVAQWTGRAKVYVVGRLLG